MDFLKTLGLNLWTNHRKKLIAFLFTLLFAGMAAVSGIPIGEIKDAAKEAADKPAPIEVVAPLPAPALVSVAPASVKTLPMEVIAPKAPNASTKPAPIKSKPAK